jgi:hypothetical protein
MATGTGSQVEWGGALTELERSGNIRIYERSSLRSSTFSFPFNTQPFQLVCIWYFILAQVYAPVTRQLGLYDCIQRCGISTRKSNDIHALKIWSTTRMCFRMVRARNPYNAAA